MHLRERLACVYRKSSSAIAPESSSRRPLWKGNHEPHASPPSAPNPSSSARTHCHTSSCQAHTGRFARRLHRRPEFHDFARARTHRHPGLHPAESTDDHLAAQHQTGLSRAAVRRCLYTLTKLGFAGAEDGSRYSLRPRMLTLSHTYTASNTLSTAAQPILERMSAALRESFSVATLDGDDIVYVARTQSTASWPSTSTSAAACPRIAPAWDASCSPTFPPSNSSSTSPASSSLPIPPRTVNSVEKLRLALRNVRRNGYALCDQEYEVGLRSLAVPVYASSGRVVATHQPQRKRSAPLGSRDADAASCPTCATPPMNLPSSSADRAQVTERRSVHKNERPFRLLPSPRRVPAEP